MMYEGPKMSDGCPGSKHVDFKVRVTEVHTCYSY